MRISILKPVSALLFVAVFVTGEAMAAPPLRAGGTGSAIGMLKTAGAEFATATGVKVQVIPSLGSTGAIRALIDRKLDIAVVARPLKAEESAAGLRQVAAMRTAFVFASSHRDVGGWKSADLPKIVAAENPTWPDGTPIRVILRPRSETDTALIGELFPGMDKAIETLRRRPEVPIAATDQDNAALGERVPGSLIGITQTQLKTEPYRLHVVPLDGIEPTFANFESGKYRFAKKLYVVARADGAPDVSRFVNFLQSPPGLKALREADVLPGGE
jgi:phosphate transport system substrate-binding protein